MKRLALILALAAAAGGCQRKKKLEVDDERNAPPVPADAAPGARPFPQMPAAEMTALRIERAGQPAVVLRREGDAWMLVEPEPAPADARAVAFALREIERMEWDPTPVATDQASWTRLRVTDDQVVTLQVSAGARELPALHVGPSRHVRIGDNPAVWHLYHLDHFTFARELRLWKAGAVPE